MKKILYILLFVIFISSIAAAGASDANETMYNIPADGCAALPEQPPASGGSGFQSG